MARPLRIQYPGAVYHITCRGNEQRKIFLDDEDRKRFLCILAQSLVIYSAKLHAYVLMDNHFHLLLETPLANLSEIMRHFNISYTGFFNRRHKRVGHLYQGRYKSILVEKDAYLSVLSRYIHLNPIRLKKLAKSPAKEKLEYLLNYSWSSFPAYIDPHKRNGMLDCSLVLADYGGDTAKGRKAYLMQVTADIDTGLTVKNLVFGQSILGSEEFITWVKATFLQESELREQPSAVKIKHYQKKETILELIEKETGKNLEKLRREKGNPRRIAIDLLYRFGGLKGPEIGALMGIDYSAVSQERKRLREGIARDQELGRLMSRLEDLLST